MFKVKFRGDDARPTQAEYLATRRAALDAMGRELQRVAPGIEIPQRSQTLARVKGHATLARWAPIQLGAALMQPTGATFTPGLEHVTAFQGAAPEKGKPWAVLLEPCSLGSYAWAIVSGLALSSVVIATASRPNAGADIGSSGSLEVFEGGAARILWRQSGIGLRPCVLDLAPITPRSFVALTVGSIGAGVLGTVQPTGNTALTIDAFNEASGSIAAGAKVGCTWDDYNGRYFISMEFC